MDKVMSHLQGNWRIRSSSPRSETQPENYQAATVGLMNKAPNLSHSWGSALEAAFAL